MKRFNKILVAAPVGRTTEVADWLGLVARCADTREAEWQVLVEPPLPVPGRPDPAWCAEDDAEPVAGELRSRGWPESLSLRIEAIAAPYDKPLLRELSRGHHDLVIVASREAGFRPLAEKVCRKAACSVLVIPPGACARPEGVQVAIDLSDFSEESLEVGAAFARGLSIGTPRAIHSWWLPESELRAPLPYAELRPLIERTARERLAKFVAAEAPGDLNWTSELIEAPLASTGILEASRRRPSDLLVISHRGEDALFEGLLGTTAAEVVRHVECPCLVVKRKGAGLRLLRDLLGLPCSPRGGLP